MTGNSRVDGRAYMAGFAVLAVLSWGAIKGLLLLGRPDAALVAMMVVVVLALSATFAFRGRLDEAGRAAERFAWYWGSGGFMALTLAALGLYLALGAPGIGVVLRSNWTPIELVALGAFGMAAAQIAGFAVAGLVWWQTRR